MPKTQKSIVFCHGLCADGSCFSKLIVPLQAEGYECIATQHGLNTTAEDVAVTKETMAEVLSPAPELTIVSSGWFTSPRSHRTPMKRLRRSSPTSRGPTCSLTSKSSTDVSGCVLRARSFSAETFRSRRSEEHTSELQSLRHLV